MNLIPLGSLLNNFGLLLLLAITGINIGIFQTYHNTNILNSKTLIYINTVDLLWQLALLPAENTLY